MAIPSAMLTNKFILSFRATAIADPLSAAPPMIARNSDADEIATCEGSAYAFGNIHQNSAHPGRRHRAPASGMSRNCRQPGGTVLPPGGLLDDRSNSSCIWTANRVTCDFWVTPISKLEE
jgi:hypothetical protein